MSLPGKEAGKKILGAAKSTVTGGANLVASGVNSVAPKKGDKAWLFGGILAGAALGLGPLGVLAAYGLGKMAEKGSKK